MQVVSASSEICIVRGELRLSLENCGRNAGLSIGGGGGGVIGWVQFAGAAS